MIGTAVAIANKVLPTNFIEIATQGNCNIKTPIAPSEPLILHDCGIKPRKNISPMDLNHPLIQYKVSFEIFINQ